MRQRAKEIMTMMMMKWKEALSKQDHRKHCGNHIVQQKPKLKSAEQPACRTDVGVHVVCFGRGCSDHHKRSEEHKEEWGITISMGYCFMVDEENEEDTVPVLIWYDHVLKRLKALPVERTGVDDTVVKWCMGNIEEAGYSGSRITMKSDQEPAIVALKRASIVGRTAPTVPIESPVRESRSNGRIENAVRVWQGQFRTLKKQFEDNVKQKLKVGHALTTWLGLWAGEVIFKYKVRDNGRTAYEEMTGHRCSHKAVGFGQKVQFMTTPDKSKNNKFEGNWSVCYFIGVQNRSGERLIVKENGLYRCKTIRAMTHDQSYSDELMQMDVVTVDAYLREGAKTKLGIRDVASEPSGILHDGDEQDDKGSAPRRVRIERAYVRKYGYTPGCRGCILGGNGSRTAQGSH